MTQGPAPASLPASRPADNLQFSEIDAAAAGIDFVHSRGAAGEKYVVETMGSGLALFDANGDGELDVYFAQGAPMPGCKPFDTRSKLYIGDGNWKFRDVTDTSGCATPGYAMGTAVGDMDNDGNLDLYVSAWGTGHLYQNSGNARFIDITEKSGAVARGFLSSAAFGDLDNDGFVDLYVVNYLDYDEAQKNPYCGKHTPGGRAYCSPHAFSGARDYLFKNLKNGAFADVSRETGVARASKVDGKGLGIVLSDLDGDGDLDIVIANDSCANFLYQNNGNFKFNEIAAVAGVAFAEDGHERAGMGIDSADINGDGRPDIFITNLAAEPNSLFVNNGGMFFEDQSGVSGLGPPSVPFVGFGCVLADFDGDGDRDVFIVNGHILDNPEDTGDMATYRQRPLLFENNGKGKFKQTGRAQAFFNKMLVLRGLASGDLDHDGDADIVISQNEGAPILLKNTGSPQNGRIVLQFQGNRSNRAAIGAQVSWSQAGVACFAEARTASSYLSSSPAEITIGCGSLAEITSVSVRWPNGSEAAKQVIPRLLANHRYLIQESGEVKDLGKFRDR